MSRTPRSTSSCSETRAAADLDPDLLVLDINLPDINGFEICRRLRADGSQVPDGGLVEAVDASAGDAECLIYTRGDFNETAMTFGAGHTADTVREGLRDKCIFLSKAQGA